MLLTSTEVESFTSRLDLGVLQGKGVLITGGTGMVGSYLVESLCKGLEVQKIFPREIRVLSGSGDFSSLKHLQRFKSLVFHEKRLSESHELGGFEFLIHAASPASPTKFSSPEVLQSINVKSFSKLITRDTERALFVSSGEVYGADAPTPVPENYSGVIDANLSRSAYALAKIEGEIRGRELCVAQGAEFRVGRLFHTFGPGVRKNDGRSFADFLWQSAKGKKPMARIVAAAVAGVCGCACHVMSCTPLDSSTAFTAHPGPVYEVPVHLVQSSQKPMPGMRQACRRFTVTRTLFFVERGSLNPKPQTTNHKPQTTNPKPLS